METSDSIVFPCDTLQWSDVKQKLIEARNVAGLSSEELIVYLQKVSASVATSPRVHDCTAGARPKVRNIFADLKYCLDNKNTPQERDAYLTRVLLHIVDRAVAIEAYRPSESEDILGYRDSRGTCEPSPTLYLVWQY